MLAAGRRHLCVNASIQSGEVIWALHRYDLHMNYENTMEAVKGSVLEDSLHLSQSMWASDWDSIENQSM